MYIHNVYRNALQCIYPMYIYCTTMYIPVHYNVYFRYPLCTMYLYIGLHLNIHWGAHLYTLCCILCHTMYIDPCYPMYIHVTQCISQYTLGIHIVLHLHIHCVASHIHCVTFFVTQCIYKNMFHNVYTSKCTTMYIRTCYRMYIKCNTMYQPPNIVEHAKKGYIHCVAFYIHCVYTL